MSQFLTKRVIDFAASGAVGQYCTYECGTFVPLLIGLQSEDCTYHVYCTILRTAALRSLQ